MATRRPLVLAMAKGRVLDQAVPRFVRAGYDLTALTNPGRKLIVDCGGLRVLLVRAGDVPTYVASGAADLGVAGSDVLDEGGWDLAAPLDLGIGRCRLVLAEPAGARFDDDAQLHLRVGTKYPGLTRRYLQARGITAEIVELSGSVELGPLTGLCHRIVDLTETGETLRQNGLVEVETIAEVSSRLVVGAASLSLRGPEVRALVDALAGR